MANQRPYRFTAFMIPYSGQSAWIETMGFAVGEYAALTP